MNRISEKLILATLYAINNNNNIESIRRLGYEYPQIAKCVNGLLQDKYIEIRESILVLSIEGLERLKELEIQQNIHNTKKEGLDNWRFKQDNYWKEPMDIYTIYLPRKLKTLLRR